MALTPITIEKWPEKPIILRQENDVNSRIFQIDLTDYIEEFGAGGTFGIRIQRLADGNIWTGEVEADGGIVTWTVPAAAVAKGGRGFIQFVYSIEGTLVANTPLIPTITPASIPTDENPPDPWLPWTEQIESEIAALERNKQDVLTFDQTPTADSQNPVTSGGVKAALDNKADKVMDTTPGELAALDAAGNLRNSNLLASDVSAHLADRNNPHEVTKAQVGLGNVDNTSDANKPISTAQQTALNGKADKVAGAVANDLAALDASGNLKDAGKKLSDLQDKLTFDLTPTNGSANPVTSGGVYEALTHKAEKSVVEAIEELIPSQASPQNKLTDKEFVNSSIATNTADYISNNGEPFTSVAQLEAYSGPVTNNDYAFVTGVDADGNTYYDRYKATVSGLTVTWAKEYRLNNSSFTTEQWAAIQSGITDTLVAAYNAHLLDRNNPHEVTKAQVGLGNVDNTSDANKPVSTAQQTALNGKADKVTGAVADDLAALDASGNLLDSGKKLADLQDKLTFDTEPTAGSTNPVTSGGVKTALDGKADKVTGAVAGDLAALDANGNIADSNVSASAVSDHLASRNNPHEVTKAQVGLGNVDNTSDANKPVSTAQQTALDGKADKVVGATEDDLVALDANGNLKDSGKKLSDLQDKLTFDAAPTAGSANPVTSGGVKTALDGKADKVAGAVADDLAALDVSGNLTDSGKKLSDLQLASFGNAANDPEQSSFDVLMNPAAKGPIVSSIIKGRTVPWNQLVQNGDFSDGTTGWTALNNATLTASNKIAQLVASSQDGLAQSTAFSGISDHVYYVSAMIKLSTETNLVQINCTGMSNWFIQPQLTTNWQNVEGIKAAPSTGNKNVNIRDRRSSGWDAVQFTNVKTIDLTNSPVSSRLTEIGTNVSKLKQAWLEVTGKPLQQYIPYDAGSLKNVDGEYQLTGKNLCDISKFTHTGIGTDNGISITSNARLFSDKIKVNPNGAYTFSIVGQSSGGETIWCNRIIYFDSDGVFISRYAPGGATTQTITIPEDCAFIVIDLRTTNQQDIEITDISQIQLEKGSAATAYEPYYNGGVIDCSADPLNGAETARDEANFATRKRIDRSGMVDLGTLTYTYDSNLGAMRSYGITDAKGHAAGVLIGLVNACGYKQVGTMAASTEDKTICLNSTSHSVNTLWIKDSAFTDPSAFATAMTGKYLCYELATPVDRTIAIQALHTKAGYNILQPISGGVQSVEVETTYVKDENTGKMLEWIEAQTA